MQWNAGVWNNPLSCTSQRMATVEGSWQEIRTKTVQSTAESDHREGQDRATAGQADGPGREGLVEDLQSLFTTYEVSLLQVVLPAGPSATQGFPVHGVQV